MEAVDIFERQTHPDKEITFGRLTKATIDTIKLLKSKDTHFVGAMELVGMKAAFPEIFSNPNLRKNPNLRFFNAVTWLGVEVNDAVDIFPQARRAGNQEIIEKIFKDWKGIIRITRKVPGFSEEQERLLTDYQREILFLESYAKKFGEQSTLSDIRSYREVMNAISVTYDAGALLGTEVLPTRMKTISKGNLSWEALRDKYGWMINNKPQNDTERRLCALFNLVMGIQIVDDYCDLEDDRRLGLKTMATELLKDKPDRDVALQRITVDSENYFHKAEELGATESAWKGMRFFFQAMKGLMGKFPNAYGGRRERLLNGGKNIFASN